MRGSSRVARRLRVAALVPTVIAGLMFVPGHASAAGGDIAGIEVRLPAGHRISGTVTNGTGAVAGANVNICRELDLCDQGGETGADGNYTIPGVISGSYFVRVFPPDNSPYLSAWYTPGGPVEDQGDAVPITVGSANVVGVDLALTSGLQVSGVVTGSTGAVLKGVFVQANAPAGGQVATTNADGAYVLRGLRPDSYALQVFVPEGLNFVSGPVDGGTVVQDGGTPLSVTTDVGGVDIVVPKGLRLRGQLTGAGAASARVEAFGSQASAGAEIAADGSWTVRGLWPDTYQLVFAPPSPPDISTFPLGYWVDSGTLTPDFAQATPVSLTSVDVSGLDATIPPGVSISGTVTATDGTPLDHALVSLCGDGSIGCGATFTGPSGAWQFAHLNAANYTVKVGHATHVGGYFGPGGYSADEGSATVLNVAGSSITGVNVRLPAGYTISGHVTAPDGGPIVGANVHAYDGGGIEFVGPGGDVTAADGSFDLRGLSAGSYWIGVNLEHPTDYIPGYYDSDARGGYTAEFDDRTIITVPRVGSSYVPISPRRVVDSRIGLGVPGIFSANVAKSFQVGGVGPIPAGATAVTGNVTVVNQTAAGYVAITPTATSDPATSTINFPLGDIRANNFTLPLSGAGTLTAVFRAAAGKKVHVIVDITGYFMAGNTHGTYSDTGPVRILDTRPAPLRVGPLGRFTAGASKVLSVAGANGIPADAIAITGNLTVVGQSRAGYLSVTPAQPSGTPGTSSLNFPVGDIRANGLTAQLNGSGDLAITYTAPAGATTDVILDVTGYYRANPAGLLFYPVKPGRFMDTRPGVIGSGLTGTFKAGVMRTLGLGGVKSVPAGVDAITGNLTVVGQTAAGFIAVTPNPAIPPTTSSLNFPLADIRANGVTVPISGAGKLSIVYKASSGKTTHLLMDVTGYFD